MDESIREFWYDKAFINYQILRFVENRESVFIERDGLVDGSSSTVRPITLWSIDGVQKYYEYFDFFERPFDFYASNTLINYRGLESSPDPKKLSKLREKYKKKWYDIALGEDFVIDIDYEESFKNAKRDAIDIYELLREYKVPFICLFSGNKGYHFRIRWAYTNSSEKVQQTDIKRLPKLYKELAKKIADESGANYGETGIDPSIYTERRITRVPYTLHAKTDLVALPLNYGELKRMSKKDFRAHAVYSNFELKNRGLQEKARFENIRNGLIGDRVDKLFKGVEV